MAAEDGFSIDVPTVLGIAAKLSSLTSSGSSAVSELGSAVLSGISFATIGSELASVNSALEQQTSSALQQLMQLFGQTNTSVSTAATGYADLDQQIAAMLGGSSSTTSTTASGVDDGLSSLTGASSPSAVQQRWNSLSPDQQQRLIANHPNEIGAMNGIPVTARDQANRSVLSTMQQQAQSELEGAKSDLASGAEQGDLSAMLAAQSHVEASQKQVDALQHLQTVVGDGSSQQYLLGVNQNGPGQWIVASGNPDTAQHIVTLVPGMETTLSAGSVDTLASHSGNLLAASANAAPGESTSVVTWAGYNSPQNLQALDPSYARAGAGGLQSFQQSLYATHDSTPFTTTVAAHSYGTLVATDAAMAPGGLRTDALAYLDSPGVPAPSAASLGIPHVFATATTNDAVVNGSDFIGKIGAYEYNGNVGPGMTPILNPQAQAYHGIDPLSPSFGATTFDAGTGTPGLFNGITAHSDVFNPAYPGPANIGKIVTGHYGAITPRK
jgi:hypothetical protein